MYLKTLLKNIELFLFPDNPDIRIVFENMDNISNDTMLLNYTYTYHWAIDLSRMLVFGLRIGKKVFLYSITSSTPVLIMVCNCI